MWRKFRGHAVIGANTAAVNAAAGPRGRGGSIFQRSQRGGRGRGSMDGGRGFGPPGGFVMPPGRPPMGGFPGGGMMQYPPRYGPPGYR